MIKIFDKSLVKSGFRPSNSCINQLPAITHEIFESFDCNPSLEVRSVFLDISKAFDKFWYKCLLYKGLLYNLNLWVSQANIFN